MQTFQCSSFIWVLISFVLAYGNDSSRDMSCSHSTISFVNMLSSRPTRSICVNSDVFIINVKLLGHLCHHENWFCTWMHPAHFLSLRHSLHSIKKVITKCILVNSWLMLKVLINIPIVWCNLKNTEFAALVNSEILMIFLHLATPSHPLAVSLVHGHEIFCEKTRLTTSSRLSYLKSHIFRVYLAFWDSLIFDLCLKVIELLLKWC